MLKRINLTHFRGLIPDFHADTQSYLSLKTCYKNKAESDRELFKSVYLKQVLTEKNISEDNHPKEEQIEIFLKNWLSLTAIEYRTLEQEYSEPKKEWVFDDEDSNKWYFCIRASDEFFKAHGKYPGPGNEGEIEGLVSKLIADFKFEPENGEDFSIDNQYIQEM